MNYPKALYQLLSSQIYKHFRAVDNPPADEIHVPVEKMKPVAGEPGFFTAVICFVVDYCGRKHHTVTIKFGTDTNNKFITNNWTYV
jgi:hypothetical protein